MWRRLNSLQGRLTFLLAVAGLAGALIYAGVTQWPLPQLLVWLRKDLALSIRTPMQLGIYGGLLASVIV
ncbi:ATP-binding protein, partial [Rhodanobacter denitrificans]|nr:ATP-binding protein [Rhodanobacter denitrificans]